jgi:hypothetical protein
VLLGSHMEAVIEACVQGYRATGLIGLKKACVEGMCCYVVAAVCLQHVVCGMWCSGVRAVSPCRGLC